MGFFLVWLQRKLSITCGISLQADLSNSFSDIPVCLADCLRVDLGVQPGLYLPSTQHTAHTNPPSHTKAVSDAIC